MQAKEAPHNIWQAEIVEKAYKAFDNCIEHFSPKYPKAMECLAKDKDSMLTFYDYLAENWRHIRTTNKNQKLWKSDNILDNDIQIDESGQKKWFRLRGYTLQVDIIQGIKFVKGVKQNGDQKQQAT